PGSTIDAAITEILGDYQLDLGGWDSTELRQVSGDAALSIFELGYINRKAFFSGDKEDPQPIDQRTALEQLLGRFGARAMQWGGWKIDSVDAQKSWSTTFPTVSSDWGLDLYNAYLPSAFQAEIKYRHDAGQGLFTVNPGDVYGP
ncbi:hypothetical protein RZS08_28700, partial [Arthrospira platensis SPKY1]|nr:hypothetical protein [Arthrospira platensis SPKY1]